MNVKLASTVAIAGFGAILALTGCTGTPTPAATSSSASSHATVSVPSSPAVLVTAASVQNMLAGHGLPMANLTVQTASTDPNQMMGRPHGYTSRAAFDITSVHDDTNAQLGEVARGGVIEVYTSARDASNRAAYIEGVTEKLPPRAGEYDYVSGVVLVRITGQADPSVADAFRQVLMAAHIG